MTTHMHCTTTEAHKSHEWDSDVVRFGPYLCDGSEGGQPVIRVPQWVKEEFKRAEYRTKNRETSAEQAWQEGYQAGLWYGKGGETADNPYAFKESL